MAHAVSCMYCGKPVGRVKKGEHVVPEAIGGAVTIANVCQKCNNRVSDIDRELCSRSPLSLVASQAVGGGIWQCWDLDEKSGNLLIEGRLVWDSERLAYKHVLQYPQVIFESGEPQIRGDLQEMLHSGPDDFQWIVHKAIRKAFQRHKHGEKRFIHFEHIEPNAQIARGYRFPPRAFWRHTISEIGRDLLKGRVPAFILRYINKSDCRHALNAIDNWELRSTSRRVEIRRGSRVPPVRCYHDAGKVLRALTKIAINLLVLYCKKTPVNSVTFRDAFGRITGNTPVTIEMIKTNGFVLPSDIASIAGSNGEHSFRLMYDSGYWNVFSSFFGGKIGTFVSFPGRSNEIWRSADVVAPISSKDWSVDESNILRPLSCRIMWSDLLNKLPSLEFVSTGSEIHIERS